MLLLRVVGAHQGVGAELGQPGGLEGEGIHARKQHAQGWIQRDGEQRRQGHGQVLGVGQGLEEAPLLVHQGEDGHEGHGHHQQAEEDRGAHLQQGIQAHLVEVAGTAGTVPLFELLVGVLHLHDGAVHQHADGDGDAGEAHEVRVEAHGLHGDEGQGHAHGDGDDGHDGRGDVPEEDQDHQGDDEHLLHQLPGHGADGLLDELRAVVGGDDLHPLGHGRFQVLQLLLHGSDDIQGVLALAHDDDATHGVALPVQVRQASPQVRPQGHGGHIPQAYGGAILGLQHRLLEVLEGLHIAPAPHHVLAARDLNEAAPGLAVGGLHRRND